MISDVYMFILFVAYVVIYDRKAMLAQSGRFGNVVPKTLTFYRPQNAHASGGGVSLSWSV